MFLIVIRYNFKEKNMIKKITLCLSLIASIVLISFTAKEKTETGGIHFENISLENAKVLSKKTGKPIFIDCYTVWCGPCKRMAKGAFMDAEIAEIYNEKFINLKIEMEKDEEGPGLARRYRVNAYPTLVIINSKGELLKKKIGMQNVAGLKALAASVN